MSDFADKEHDISSLIFQGSTLLPIEEVCNSTMIERYQQWLKRSDRTKPDNHFFELENALTFTISYEGIAKHYYPDVKSNFIIESLVRQFLFHNGICTIDSFEPRLYLVKYNLIAFVEKEYLLICPYPTVNGNINGLVVVCVNKYLVT